MEKNDYYIIMAVTLAVLAVFVPLRHFTGAATSGTATCTDSDGLNSSILGYVYGTNIQGQPFNVSDHCINTTALYEQICVSSGNNTVNQTVSINCQGSCQNGRCIALPELPDLIVTRVLTIPANPRVNQNTYFNITIKNIGATTTKSVSHRVRIVDKNLAQCRDDGTGCPQRTATKSGGLQKNQEYSYKYGTPYKFTRPGVYKIIGEVDYTKKINESNENNNLGHAYPNVTS